LTASLSYRLRANRLVIVHTDVPAELRGHGLGPRLVDAAVALARRRGDTVVPLCPFARAWLQQHPDVAAAVDIDWGPTPGVPCTLDRGELGARRPNEIGAQHDGDV
jgi:predicted GNAT family acetyltransferase